MAYVAVPVPYRLLFPFEKKSEKISDKVYNKGNLTHHRVFVKGSRTTFFGPETSFFDAILLSLKHSIIYEIMLHTFINQP